MPPFSALRIARYAGLTEMPPHAHDTTTVCLPLRGRYVERTRGRESEHRLGDILLCPAAEEHSQLFPCGRVTKLLMTPTEDMLGFLAESLPLGEAPHGRFAGLGSLAIRLADELDHEHGATDAASGVTGSAPTPRMDLATSLVVRESTAPPGG